MAMRIGKAELPAELLGPILQHIPAKKLAYTDGNLKCCSLVCQLWRNEAVGILFKVVKIHLWHRSFPTVDNIHSLLRLATTYPHIPTSIREVRLDVSPLSQKKQANHHTGEYRMALEEDFPKLIRLITRLESLEIGGSILYREARDAWFKVLGPQCRAAIRSMCAIPSLKQLRDQIGLPYSVWIHNSGISRVELSSWKLSTGPSSKLEAAEANSVTIQAPETMVALDSLLIDGTFHEDQFWRGTPNPLDDSLYIHSLSLANDHLQAFGRLRSLELTPEPPLSPSPNAIDPAIAPLQTILDTAANTLCIIRFDHERVLGEYCLLSFSHPQQISELKITVRS